MGASCLIGRGFFSLPALLPRIFGESVQSPILYYLFNRVIELVTFVGVVVVGLMVLAVPCLIRLRGLFQRPRQDDARLPEYLADAFSEDGLS